MMIQQQPDLLSAYEPPVNKKHQRVFGILLFLFNIGISIVYGFYGYPQTPTVINVSSIVITIFLAMLVIVGFGLYMSYFRYILWSGLGVAFLIVCISIELYPLINAFWSKVGIFNNSHHSDSFETKGFYFFLSNFEAKISTGNTITGSLRSALSIVIGLSGVIGRATSLQILFIGIISTVTFELNRQLAAQLSMDQFGSFTIFGFGGFLSFGLGLIYLFMQKQRPDQDRTSKPSATAISLIGSLLMFVFLPVLSFEGDNSMKKEIFTNYVTPLCLIMSMGAAIVATLAINTLINGNNIKIRDIQNGLIAGAVAGGTASYFITNLAFAILCGFTAGISQPIFEQILEKILYKKLGFFCTYPPGVFGLQSLLGAIFTALYAWKVNQGSSNDFIYSQPTISSGSIFVIFCISASIGFGTGLFLGILCNLIRCSDLTPSLRDRQLWMMTDGIHLDVRVDKNFKNFAPQIAINLSQIQEKPKPQNLSLDNSPQLIKKTTSGAYVDISLDIADMFQVIIE